METKFYMKLYVNIVLMFAIIILLSFVADNFHQQMGDWLCKGSTEVKVYDTGNEKYLRDTSYIGCQYKYGAHDPEWHWGFRHHMIIWLGICLFLLNIFRIAMLIYKFSTQSKQ